MLQPTNRGSESGTHFVDLLTIIILYERGTTQKITSFHDAIL